MFLHGSGSADPYPRITDPDPDAALFFICFLDVKKKISEVMTEMDMEVVILACKKFQSPD
jgi:hypothetical protein